MENIGFEEALTRLEGSVRRLEGGSITLDEALATFEEAVGLVKICNERLDRAEQRVRVLTEGEDGVISDKPFDDENEA